MDLAERFIMKNLKFDSEHALLASASLKLKRARKLFWGQLTSAPPKDGIVALAAIAHSSRLKFPGDFWRSAVIELCAGWGSVITVEKRQFDCRYKCVCGKDRCNSKERCSRRLFKRK
uniref:Uncharacterized protein n=1 Tax=Lotharella globosa TaxID=91324 RepID=A0A7S3ZAB9_9EUKA